MKKLVIIFAISGLISCSQNDSKHNSISEDKNEVHHHDKSDQLQLNNGEKWKVDEAMMIHLKNMDELVSTYLKNGNNSKQFSEELTKEIELLTSSCTMKGQAHDELHKWLLPFIELSSKLSEAKSPEEVKSLAQEMNDSFKEYFTYFE